MTTFKKKLETFFVYFFTGISILVVVLGIQKAKDVDAFATKPAPPEDNGDSGTKNQQSSVFGALASNSKVLGASESVSVVGKSYPTPWGDLATSVNIKNGEIISVEIPTLPNSPQSIYARPILINETLRAGSANVQAVTGATITSNAFKASLESAIARAKVKNPIAVLKGNGMALQTNESAPSTPQIITETPIIKTPRASVTLSSGVSGTFAGNAYSTKWGNTVASVTFTNGIITAVSMPQVPNSPPSIQAESFLIEQALATGSANIQGVSGATVVSDAFKLSLESAIAKARAQGTISTPVPTTAISTTQMQTITTHRYKQRMDRDNDDHDDDDHDDD